MRNSNSIMTSTLILAVCLGLTACKSNKSSKTTLHRSKAGQTKVGPDGKPVQTDNKGTGTGSGNATGTGTGTGTGSNTTSPAVTVSTVSANGAADAARCQTLQNELSNKGWESRQIDTTETAQANSRKLKITYYTLKGSKLENPVLVLQRTRTRSVISDTALKAISDAATAYSFDPIYVDIRGSGCSTNYAMNMDSWQNYGSTEQAQDMEKVRNALKIKKWKIWSRNTSGYTALRLIELFPTTIQSLHMGDFTPMKNQEELMKLRIETQAEVWEDFKTYAKSKNLGLESDDIKKIKATLAKAKKVGKISGENLLEMIIAPLAEGTVEAKDFAVDTLSALLKGEEKVDKLQDYAKAYEDSFAFEAALRMVDIDSDLNLKACEKALKSVDQSDKVKNSVINSCRLEALMGTQEIEKLKAARIHNVPLNTAKVADLMDKNQISYYAAFGGKSLYNPKIASTEHTKEFAKALKEDVNSMDFDKEDSDVYMNKDLLKTLSGK